ncbi:MAG TPA: 3-dehydroquinate synthase II [Methanospirillum sp.]|nr:3-dehydroquinate synthase II [Methanospirillum sp.]
MKQVLVDVRPWNKEIAIAALESGADGIVTDAAGPVRELGRITVIAPDGDLIPGTDIIEITIRSTEDQDEAMQIAKRCPVIVHTPDWTVIPLENLVAVADSVIGVVTNVHETELALGILEKGVAGVLVKTQDPEVIRDIVNLIKRHGCHQDLIPLTITSITPAGIGDRVCVDTCSLMIDGEGMLVGNTSSGFFLVHAETLENPYVAPRPFRVNAGAVHAYLKLSDGKTAYLADLKAGNRVMVSGAKGSCREATVGRVKIELRPLLLVEAEFKGAPVSIILQNAETIRLAKPDGGAISVAVLKPGDIVLGAIESGGRHFGMAVKETILEK